MASIRVQKKIQRLQQKRIQLEAQKLKLQRLQEAPTSFRLPTDITISEDNLKLLQEINAMLCESAYIARTRFPENAPKLQNIIANQHKGLEGFLTRHGITIQRSAVGTAFDPEYMEAVPEVADTTDPALYDTVAQSVTPGYHRGNEILRYERVQLYGNPTNTPE